MLNKIKIEKANIEDATILTTIQIEAFKQDKEICGDGPPGYNSVEEQVKKIKEFEYFKISLKKEIIGGFYYSQFEQHKIELIRIFLIPKYHNRGFGTSTLDFIENLPNVTCIELEASDFNTSNQIFYEKRGFIQISTKKYDFNSYSFIYQKNI